DRARQAAGALDPLAALAGAAAARGQTARRRRAERPRPRLALDRPDPRGRHRRLARASVLAVARRGLRRRHGGELLQPAPARALRSAAGPDVVDVARQGRGPAAAQRDPGDARVPLAPLPPRSLLSEGGHDLLGIDQSAGMLRRAHAKFPAVPTEKLGLQELAREDAFDGVVCIDALELVFPEDWPRVLANVHRALRAGGPFYFTVELPEEDLPEVFRAAVEAGLPVVEGEYVKEGG